MSLIWHKRFLSLAHEVSTWSRDPSTKVGSIIADADNNPLTLACNGFPRKIIDSKKRFNNKQIKHRIIKHAEENAVANCARIGVATKGCTIYITEHPCARCAGAIIQAGIKRIIISKKCLKSDFAIRWKDDIKLAKEILKEAKIIITIV